MATSGLSDVSVTLAARMGTVVLGVGLQSCLAWLLGPEDRGAYSVAVVYCSLLAVGSALGLDGAAQYLVAANRTRLQATVSALLVLQTGASLLGMLVGFAALQLPLEFFAKAEPRAFLLAVLTIPAEMISAALLLLLGSQREFRVQAILTVVRMALRVGLVVALVWGGGLGVEGALFANLFAFAVSGALNVRFLRRHHDLRWVRPNAASVRELLGYGSRYYFAAFSMLISAQVGVIMVAFLASAKEVGLFSAAVGLVTYTLMLSDAVGAALHPRIAEDAAGRPELTAQAARVVGVLTTLLLIAMVGFARPLIEILLSPSFLPVVPLVSIVAFGIAVRSATKVLVSYFNATNRPQVFSLATGVGMFANAALVALLLPRFGLEGAAWAMTAAYFLNGSVLVFAFHRQSGLGVLECWRPRIGDLDLARAEVARLRRKRWGA